MIEMGLDLTDDSLSGTPARVAKLYATEMFTGLNGPKPRIMTVEDKFNYDQMLIEKGIAINSCCEHHFLPIIGECTIAYIPDKKVLGLSKLNRVAQYHAAKPQVQERLTEDILKHIQDAVDTENVAVLIDAAHMCVKMRGIKDHNCITRTTALGGNFRMDSDVRKEFLSAIGPIRQVF
jgi:GTP cyclohydrolase I